MIPLINQVDQGTLVLCGFSKALRTCSMTISEVEMAKREDLETLFFIIIYLIKGSCPWAKPGKEEFTKEARSKIEQH